MEGSLKYCVEQQGAFDSKKLRTTGLEVHRSTTKQTNHMEKHYSFE